MFTKVSCVADVNGEEEAEEAKHEKNGNCERMQLINNK